MSELPDDYLAGLRYRRGYHAAWLWRDTQAFHHVGTRTALEALRGGSRDEVLRRLGLEPGDPDVAEGAEDALAGRKPRW